MLRPVCKPRARGCAKLLVLALWLAAPVRADVYGPPIPALNSARALLESGGAGPGPRDILFNGVPLRVVVRYDRRRPLAALQRIAAGLDRRVQELRAFSSPDQSLHALLRMPRGGGRIGLTLAWGNEAGRASTLWDVELSGRQALLALFAPEPDRDLLLRPAWLEPAPGAEITLDLVDGGERWLSHTRVFSSRDGVRSRVDFYTGQLQRLGFELSQDAGFDGSSWLRSFRGPEGTLNLFVRAPRGGSPGTDVLQFHTMR
jgi:hypothetical protein